jgi:hypothetical protein
MQHPGEQIIVVHDFLLQHLQDEMESSGREVVSVGWSDIQDEAWAKTLGKHAALWLVHDVIQDSTDLEFVGTPVFAQNGRDFLGASYRRVG